jgi:ribonucleotide monophosphatase NagD (HAD superfamily)
MIKTQGLVRDENFRPIDGKYSCVLSLINIWIILFSLAIVLLGEPVQWERSLQVITDLLLTHGNPGVIPTDTNGDHIPIIACNRDLVFKAAADLPRFGHGAFLTCLEALYKVNHCLKFFSQKN